MNLEYYFPAPVPAGLIYTEEYLRQMIKVVVAKRMIAAIQLIFRHFCCDGGDVTIASKNLETFAFYYREKISDDMRVMMNNKSFAAAFTNYHKYNIINIIKYHPVVRGNIIVLYPSYGTNLAKLLAAYINNFRIVILIIPESEKIKFAGYYHETLFLPSRHNMFIISQYIKFRGKMIVTKDTFGEI